MTTQPQPQSPPGRIERTQLVRPIQRIMEREVVAKEIEGCARRLLRRWSSIRREQIEAFCRRHGVSRLSLFGSVVAAATDDFGPESDIDILIEFPPGQTPSLLDLGGMYMELRGLFGREIDLKTPYDLSEYFRDEVVSSARMLYAA